MKFKFQRTIALLLSVLFILTLLVGCAQEESQISPILYKVTDGEGNHIWLFGSIHIGEDYFYPLPDYVLNAYNQSDALAVELDAVALQQDMQAQAELAGIMLYTDGTTIKDHISPELYNSARKILEENQQYIPAMDYYIPAMWSSAIDNITVSKLGLKTELGIDLHLLNKANEEGKPILEVESAKFQYEMLANYSAELQEFLLTSSVQQGQNPILAKPSYDQMINLWAKGDEAALDSYLNAQSPLLTAEQKLLMEEYNDALITQRNKNMTKYAMAALQSGKKVFICVGAAHIVGRNAVAQQLKALGYTVERV
ncbi:MAG: TraB/GumN family protein [Clostridia bacterium]|nr:TraB/GumN family protein [Clostridia bacterium]